MLVRAICMLAFGAWLAGCATLEHGFALSEYAGRTLPTRGGEGAQRLAAELEVDVTLRDFVSSNGRPDYLHVVDRMSLYFFYVGEDRVVRFERDMFPPSTSRDLGRIPGSLLKLLPKREVDALLARRAVAKRRQPAPTARRRSAAPVPAAPAPSGSYVRRDFDTRAIMARLRPPLTAADSGVSGWRALTFADGTTGSTATLGSFRYELRGNRLALSMPMPPGRAGLSAAARLEVLRLNGTIFGAHAKAVTEHVMGFVAQLSARGRPVAQRVRGRMVRVDRLGGGQLLYSIRP